MEKIIFLSVIVTLIVGLANLPPVRQPRAKS